MRHRKRVKKLGRDAEHRRAMLRNQVISLLRHGKIQTTLAKAKETRRWAEKMISLGRRGDLHARRLARQFLVDRKITNFLFEEVAPRYKDRPSGFTRIYRLGRRRGDGAPMALLQLIPPEEKKEEEKTAASETPPANA